MTAVLPIPPSVNHMYATVRGRRVLSRVGRKYKEIVAAMLIGVCKVKPMEGPISVKVDIYRARKAGDLDNFYKSLSDALKGIAWHDDKQVVEIHMLRFDDKENPRAVVEWCVAA